MSEFPTIVTQHLDWTLSQPLGLAKLVALGHNPSRIHGQDVIEFQRLDKDVGDFFQHGPMTPGSWPTGNQTCFLHALELSGLVRRKAFNGRFCKSFNNVYGHVLR